MGKGYYQNHGLYFNETFSPVVKPTIIRFILSLVVQLNWPLKQFDVTIAFLHGYLQEDIYIIHPPGCKDKSNPHLFCIIHKSLHGLKHAPKAWYGALRDALLSFSYVQSKFNCSLFIKSVNKNISVVLVYVN